MTKYKLINILRKHGDSTLDFKDGSKPIVCTLEFKNNYIKNKHRTYMSDYKINVMVFSWTDDKYMMIKPHNVIKATPLAATLKNTKE